MSGRRLAILLGVACLLGPDSAELSPLRNLSPVSCLGLAPSLGEGAHHRAALGGGKNHCYRLELEAGDAVRAIVWQQGVDVELALRDPGGSEILKVDSPNADRGFEALYAVAEQPGEHELRIKNSKENKSGAYELRIEKLGPAEADDQRRAEAQQLRLVDPSIEGLTRALSLWRKIGDRYQEALAVKALGLAQKDAEKFLEALASLRSALALIKKLGHTEIQAGLWNDVADAHYELRELPSAITAASIALRLSRAIDYIPGQMVALNNLGLYQTEHNNFVEALEYFSEALEADVSLDQPYLRAITLHNLGRLNIWLGRLDEARDGLEEALELLRSINRVPEQIRTLIETGRLDYIEENFDDAIARYGAARALVQTLGNDFEEAGILDRLGTIYRKLGQYDLAEHCYLEAMQKLPDETRSITANDVIANLGSLYAVTGRFDRALEHLQRARLGYQQARDHSNEADSLVEIARVLYQLGDTSKALSKLAEALGIVDQLRLSSADYSLRESFLALRRWQHEAAIDLLMRLDADDPKAGYAARAFEISEQARSRSLLEMLHEARTAIRATADPRLLAKAKELSKALTAPMLEARAGKSHDAIEREKRRLGLAFEEIGSKIRGSSSVFREEMEPRPLEAPAIQQLLDDQTILLAYTLSGERSFLWLIERRRLRGFSLPPRGTIERDVRRYHKWLTQRSKTLGHEQELHTLGNHLARELLGPVASQLGRRPLVFLLDGALHSIPFGTLPDPAFLDDAQPPPLLAQHEISYLPSASVLPILRRRLLERSSPPGTVVVFADAVYTSKDEPRVPTKKTSLAPLGTLDLGSLPGSRREADAILGLVDPNTSRSVLGFEATRETFLKTDFSRYRFLHLAVHGMFDENPWFSRVVLSEYDSHGQWHSGALMLHEIHQLDIPVELVVLSACETALGKNVRGEGVIGLPRGFLYAGAARVVVSLWKVDDEATAELMTLFYREMIENRQEPAAALRTAQLTLRNNPRWRSPRYWAGFVLQGAW